MAITVQNVVDFARRRVLDTRAPTRYDDPYFIDGLNQALSTMFEIKPEIFQQIIDHTCTAGPLQTISANGAVFLSVTRNLGADGSTPGTAITLVSKERLEAAEAGWASATPAGAALHYFPAAETRNQFYLYPPQPSPPHHVELVQALPPTVYTAVGETVSLPDHYLAALGNFAAAFVLMTDDENEATIAKADRFYQTFLALIGPVETDDGGS